MKIVLCGATGFIGTEVLKQCLAHRYIHHIYCLTRKPLDEKYATHDKVTQIIHADFSQYPDHLLEKLAGYGVEGCIWALGRPNIKDFKNKEEAERVGIHFPITAATAFAAKLATKLDPNAHPNKQKFPFRFVFISGWGAEQDQFRSLWMYAESRKLKGAAEKGVFDVADNCDEIEGKKCFEAIALRAGGVIPGGDAVTTVMWEATMPYIAVERLARAAIKAVLRGSGKPDKRILENAECLGDDWAQINSLTI